MKQLARLSLFFFAVTVSLFGQSTATVTATHLIDGNGVPLASGQWCFGVACLPVTNGAIVGSTPVTQGTQTVTVTNASSTATFLIVPNVTIAASSFSWDSYTVPASQKIFSLGTPNLACSNLATYQDLYSNQIATCLSNSWVPNSQIRGSGSYAAKGVPTFACIAPCSYTQQDASPTSAALWAVIGPVGTPSITWAQQGGSGGGGGAAPSAIQQNSYVTGIDTGTVNAYAVTLSPAPTIVAGSGVLVDVANTSTGPSTLTVNGITTAIRKKTSSGLSPITAGDLVAGNYYRFDYDGLYWQTSGSVSAGGGTTTNAVTFAATGGAAPGTSFDGHAPIVASPTTLGLVGPDGTASQSNSAICVALGDSITNGSAANGVATGYSYEQAWQLYDASCNSVLNAGWSGQTSTQIVTRSGGYNGVQLTAGTYLTTLSVPGNVIPASGSATVTWGNALYDPTYSSGGSSVYPVPITLCTGTVSPTYVAGVAQTGSACTGQAATVYYNGSNVTVTLATPGNAVSVPANTPFFVDKKGQFGGFASLLMGTNNITSGGGVAQLEQDVFYFVNNVMPADPTTGLKRYVIATVPTSNQYTNWPGGSSYSSFTSFQTWLAANYPNNYIDLWADLVNGYDSTNPEAVIDHGHNTIPANLRLTQVGTATSAYTDTTSCPAVGGISIPQGSAMLPAAGVTSLVDSEKIYYLQGTTGATVNPTVSTTLNSGTVTLSSATGVVVGEYISSANIPANSFIGALSGTTATLANGAVATATASGTASTIAYCIRGYAGTTAATHSGGAVVTGSIASSVLTVTAVSSGYAASGSLTGSTSTLPSGCAVSTQASGTTGGVGTYNLTGCTGTFASQTMTLAGAPYQTIDGTHLNAAGQTLWAKAVIAEKTANDPGPPAAGAIVGGSGANSNTTPAVGGFAPGNVSAKSLMVGATTGNTTVPSNLSALYLSNPGSGYTSIPAITCTGVAGGLPTAAFTTVIAGSPIGPYVINPGLPSVTPQVCTVAAPSSGTTATLGVIYNTPQMAIKGTSYSYQTVPAQGEYLFGGSTPSSKYWCGNAGQNCVKESPSAGGGIIDVTPHTVPGSGLYSTSDGVTYHYGMNLTFNASLLGVDTFSGRLNAQAQGLVWTGPAFQANSFIGGYNGMVAASPVINIQVADNAVTLTSSVTATTTGTAYIGTQFLLHVCNTGTVYTLTLPAGFNGLGSMTPRANSCTNQLYQVNSTGNYDPVGGPSSLPYLYNAAAAPLPTCAASLQGTSLVVSDATSLSYMGAYTSGGLNTAAVICGYNGTTYSWLEH